MARQGTPKARSPHIKLTTGKAASSSGAERKHQRVLWDGTAHLQSERARLREVRACLRQVRACRKEKACRRSPHLRPTTCKAANSSGAERNTRWYSGMGESISNQRGPVSGRRGPVSMRGGHGIQRRRKLGAPEALFKSDVGRHSTSCDGRNSPPLK